MVPLEQAVASNKKQRGPGGCLDPECPDQLKAGSKWCNKCHNSSQNLKTEMDLEEYRALNKAPDATAMIKLVRDKRLLNVNTLANTPSVQIGDSTKYTSGMEATRSVHMGAELRKICFIEFKNKMNRKLDWSRERSWAHWCHAARNIKNAP